VLTVLWFGLNSSYRFSISIAVGVCPLFLVAAAGNSFFGLLTKPMMCCLGAMSFSIYMLHCIVFFLVFDWMIAAGWTHQAPLIYWLIIWGCAICVAGLCAATYRWIEFPFLSLSHKTRLAGRPIVP
jgi:peptidoglycan/LPS O-acetylase OafA/YrhL